MASCSQLDSFLIISGRSSDSTFVAQINLKGEVNWYSSFKSVPSGYIPDVSAITTDSLGNIYGCGQSGELYPYHFKLDRNGNLVWIKAVQTYQKAINFSIEFVGNYLWIGHSSFDPTAQSMLQIDPATGDVLIQTPLEANTPNWLAHPNKIIPYSGKMLVLGRGFESVNGGTISIYEPSNGSRIIGGLFVADTNLTNHIFISIVDGVLISNDTIAITYWRQLNYGSNDYVIGFSKIALNANLAFDTREYQLTQYNNALARGIQPTASGGFVITAYTNYDSNNNNDLVLLYLTNDGTLLSAVASALGTTEKMTIRGNLPTTTINGRTFLTAVSASNNSTNAIYAEITENNKNTCYTWRQVPVVVTPKPTSSLSSYSPFTVSAPKSWTSFSSTIHQTDSINRCNFSFNLGQDIVINAGDSVLITLPVQLPYVFKWSNGSEVPYYLARNNELIWVTIYKDCCEFTDTIRVTVRPMGTLPVSREVSYTLRTLEKGRYSLQFNQEQKMNIQLVNSLGAIVYSNSNVSTHDYEVDLRNFSSGIYFMKVNVKGETLVLKLVN